MTSQTVPRSWTQFQMSLKVSGEKISKPKKISQTMLNGAAVPEERLEDVCALDVVISRSYAYWLYSALFMSRRAVDACPIC